MNSFEKFIAFMQTASNKPTLFGGVHLMWIAIAIIGAVVICLTCRKLSDKKYRIILLVVGIVLIVLEILKQLNFAYDPSTDIWNYEWKQFPFQFCSVPMYVMIIVACFRPCKFRNYLCSFLATFGLFAGLVVLVYPDTVLSDVVFRFSQSMIHHICLMLVGLLTFVSGKAKAQHKTILRAIAVFAVCVAIAFIINIIYHSTGATDSFNMFYIGPFSKSDLPLLNVIGEALNIASNKLHIGNFAFVLIYIIGFSIIAYIILLIAMLIKKLCNKSKT